MVKSEYELPPLRVTEAPAIAAWSRSTTLTMTRPWPVVNPLLAGGVTRPTMSTLPRESGEETVEVILRLVWVFAVAEQPVLTEPASAA